MLACPPWAGSAAWAVRCAAAATVARSCKVSCFGFGCGALPPGGSPGIGICVPDILHANACHCLVESDSGLGSVLCCLMLLSGF